MSQRMRQSRGSKRTWIPRYLKSRMTSFRFKSHVGGSGREARAATAGSGPWSGSGIASCSRLTVSRSQRPGLLDDAAEGVADLAADDDGVGAAADLPAGERGSCGSWSGTGRGRSSSAPSGSMIVTSASAPGRRVPLGMPRSWAGLIVSLRIDLGPGQVAGLDQAA